MSSAPRIALEDLCGQSARVLLDRLIAAFGQSERVAILKAYLGERVRQAGRVHPSAERAVRLLNAAHGATSVEAVAQLCGVTSRTLRNVLLSETGLPPKHVARIIRVRHALELLRQEGLVDSAEVRRAFSDQAHLCREFRTLLGATPATLARAIRTGPVRLPSITSERDLLGTGLLIRPVS